MEWQSIRIASPKRARARADQFAQTLVVRTMKRGDPRHRVGDGNPSLVDRLRVADDARDGAQARRDAQRAGVGEFGQRTLEHLRIEFERLAVDVEKRAREMRAQQRRAERDAGQEQFVDERVLGAAQRQRVEPRGGEKALGIARARMGRVRRSAARSSTRGSTTSNGGCNAASPAHPRSPIAPRSPPPSIEFTFPAAS